MPSTTIFNSFREMDLPTESLSSSEKNGELIE